MGPHAWILILLGSAKWLFEIIQSLMGDSNRGGMFAPFYDYQPAVDFRVLVRSV